MTPNKPPIALCIHHDCPAADCCAVYVSLNVAGPDTVYFKPMFDPKRVPPCKYFKEDRPFGAI
jgi:hypothetical protein